MHTATTPLPTIKALGRNHLTPSTSTTTLCPEKIMGPKTRKMVDRLVPLHHTGKASCSPLGATNRDGNPTNREHHGQLSLQPPPPNPITSPPQSNRATYCGSSITSPPLLLSAPHRCVSRLYPHIFSFFVRKPHQP